MTGEENAVFRRKEGDQNLLFGAREEKSYENEKKRRILVARSDHQSDHRPERRSKGGATQSEARQTAGLLVKGSEKGRNEDYF